MYTIIFSNDLNNMIHYKDTNIIIMQEARPLYHYDCSFSSVFGIQFNAKKFNAKKPIQKLISTAKHDL